MLGVPTKTRYGSNELNACYELEYVASLIFSSPESHFFERSAAYVVEFKGLGSIISIMCAYNVDILL